MNMEIKILGVTYFVFLTWDVRFCASTKALYVTEDDQVLLQYHAKLVVYNSRDGILKLMKPKTSMGGFLL
jgi:hypothetical protein